MEYEIFTACFNGAVITKVILVEALREWVGRENLSDYRKAVPAFFVSSATDIEYKGSVEIVGEDNHLPTSMTAD